MARVNGSRIWLTLVGNALIALAMLAATAIPALQAQSSGGQTQSQPPASAQPAGATCLGSSDHHGTNSEPDHRVHYTRGKYN